MIRDMRLHHTLRKRFIPTARTPTAERHKGIRAYFIPTVLVIFATVGGHDGAAEAEHECCSESNLRLREHCHFSWSGWPIEFAFRGGDQQNRRFIPRAATTGLARAG
jgi:hypothetical protein